MLVFKVFGRYSSVIQIKLCKIILHKCKTCCLSNLPRIISDPSKNMFQLNIASNLITPLFSFSFFLEKNMFVFFLNILRQKSGRYVCVQLLQTLNILFENISHETSLCKGTLKLFRIKWSRFDWIPFHLMKFSPSIPSKKNYMNS